MASRKAETETPGSSASEVRAKSAVVGADTDSLVKGASSQPSYEMITQQIAYLMSAMANQTSPNLKTMDAWDSNLMGMESTLPLCFRDPREMERA